MASNPPPLPRPAHQGAPRAGHPLWRLLALLLMVVPGSPAWAQGLDRPLNFFFGGGPAPSGAVVVTPDTPYTAARGHGFEPADAPAPGAAAAPAASALAPDLAQAVAGPRAGHPVLAPAKPLYFSVKLPEGSYRITATLGGTAEASHTTLKAELRRLMLQGVGTAPGQVLQQQFTVHVRTPVIPAAADRPAGQVLLRAPRESVDEAWNWDDRLTLEINGRRPVLQALLIEPVQVPLLFVLGDSTVADQSREPYASWGQMLPRFFSPGVAVVNLAQSGETYRDSFTRRRLDKILSLARPGDTVLMQYGHNDQKQLRDGSGSVVTYQDEMRRHVQALRSQGLRPVIVTSVERRFFEADGHLRHTLVAHVAAARAVAAEMQVPLLDLNTTSRTLYVALGPRQAPALFATGADGQVDPTHHNNTGAWLLASLVAQGLQQARLPVAQNLRADAPAVLADQPPALQNLDLAPSPNVTPQRPLGDTDTAAATPVQPAARANAYPPERLARLDRAVQAEIDRGRLAGAVTFLARHGRTIHLQAQGWQDLEQRQPMRHDSLFRIASMSKAVTTVAAMILYEEGHFLLRDPVAKWLPGFAAMPVAVATSAGQPPTLEKQRRPVTVRDLLQHTAGLSYGAGPAAAEWQRAGFNDWYLLHRAETLAQWTERLMQLPLQGQPGEQFQYGYATDVLGRLVEIWSGQTLDRFVAERITGPLRLPDSHFFLPPDKAARLANVYGLEQGRLVLKETAARSDFQHGPRQLASGGAGLVSSIGDYARFLQMLLNGGELDGVRLLSPATVALLHRDHLGARYNGDAEGAGFGFWVLTSPGTRSELGSVGAYGWGSAYSPQYVVDPQAGTVFIVMTQLRPAGDSTLTQRLKVLARQALVE